MGTIQTKRIMPLWTSPGLTSYVSDVRLVAGSKHSCIRKFAINVILLQLMRGDVSNI